MELLFEKLVNGTRRENTEVLCSWSAISAPEQILKYFCYRLGEKCSRCEKERYCFVPTGFVARTAKGNVYFSIYYLVGKIIVNTLIVMEDVYYIRFIQSVYFRTAQFQYPDNLRKTVEIG